MNWYHMRVFLGMKDHRGNFVTWTSFRMQHNFCDLVDFSRKTPFAEIRLSLGIFKSVAIFAFHLPVYPSDRFV